MLAAGLASAKRTVSASNGTTMSKLHRPLPSNWHGTSASCAAQPRGIPPLPSSLLVLVLLSLSPENMRSFSKQKVTDTATLGVTTVRRGLAMIPQDPVLFQASVRFNLDPHGEYSDEDIWAVLAELEVQPGPRQQKPWHRQERRRAPGADHFW